MCRIERSYIDYPDGRREPRDVLVNCARGTPTRPCNNIEIVPVYDNHFAAAHRTNAAPGPYYHAAPPRELERTTSRPRRRHRPSGLALTFRLWNPFASKKPKKDLYLVKKKVQPRDEAPAFIPHYPRVPTPPPTPPPSPPQPPRMPSRGRTANIVTISPSPRPPERQPRRRRRRGQPAIVVQQTSSSSEEDSPSPPVAAREHQRKSRSLSPRTKFEAEKKYVKEKARRQYAERVAREGEQARKRAAKLAEDERSEKERVQERLEYEERRRIESAERARRRKQQEEQEEYERDQAKRRQELEDLEVLNARQRAARRQEEQDRRRREEHERHRLDEEERLNRARRANIPRGPRHQPAVHQRRESMEDRGERFIRDAIRQENLRRFERDLSPNPGGWRWGFEERWERRDRRSD